MLSLVDCSGAQKNPAETFELFDEFSLRGRRRHVGNIQGKKAFPRNDRADCKYFCKSEGTKGGRPLNSAPGSVARVELSANSPHYIDNSAQIPVIDIISN